MKRKDDWFNEPVDTVLIPDYLDTVKSPMDYGTIMTKLKSGAYMAAPPFAADVHLVLSNAVAYSPEPDNECHIAAKKHLIAFEEGYFKEGLATDGGAALAAAKAGAKRNSTSRKRARD